MSESGFEPRSARVLSSFPATGDLHWGVWPELDLLGPALLAVWPQVRPVPWLSLRIAMVNGRGPPGMVIWEVLLKGKNGCI